jgi:hypothetical protein
MQQNRTQNNQTPQPTSVDEQALAYLKKNGSSIVAKLYADLKTKNPPLTEEELTDAVWRMVEGNRVEVEDVPPATSSLREYLGFWERNLGLYFVAGACLLSLLAIYAIPEMFPLVAFRWVLGSIFVLFIPGYVTVEALFPKGRELDGIERFALSVGLSLAVVPLVGLLLNYTPWGIRLDPIVISLTILTLGLAGVTVLRRFRISVERFEMESFK